VALNKDGYFLVIYNVCLAAFYGKVAGCVRKGKQQDNKQHERARKQKSTKFVAALLGKEASKPCLRAHIAHPYYLFTYTHHTRAQEDDVVPGLLACFTCVLPIVIIAIGLYVSFHSTHPTKGTTHTTLAKLA
jgi:hypothetical protein